MIGESNNSLAGNTKKTSPVTLQMYFWWLSGRTSHTSNATEAHK